MDVNKNREVIGGVLFEDEAVVGAVWRECDVEVNHFLDVKGRGNEGKVREGDLHLGALTLNFI